MPPNVPSSNSSSARVIAARGFVVSIRGGLMPLFEYTARNAANGQIQKGQVDLKSKEEVTAHLR